MGNEVAKTFSESLTDKLIAVEEALPKEFNRERFVQNCLAVVNEKPELARINPAQLQLGLLKGAYLGLDFVNKECYLIPYGNSVNFQTDYKGEKKFVKRYSIRPIHDIYAKVVREGDVFEEKIVNGHPSIDFKPLPLNRGAIMGAFAVALYKDGGMDYETMTIDDIQSVRNNYSKASCGCLIKDFNSKRGQYHNVGRQHYAVKFGVEESVIRNLRIKFNSMKSRCYDTKDRNYKNYGGRGITICDEWLKDKNSFIKWALENGYEKRKSIDRIDVNGNYEPSNCRWATTSEQARNTRRNVFIKYNGETYIITDLSKKLGIDIKFLSPLAKKGIELRGEV